MTKKNIILCDLDGTLADQSHRQHFIKCPVLSTTVPGQPNSWKPDWDSYYKACVDDVPMETTIKLVQALLVQDSSLRLHIVSGRSAAVQQETIVWLNTHLDSWDFLKMRPVGDYTRDDELKKVWLRSDMLGPRDNVLCAFEDRDRVVQMYRKEGIVCYQVADGGF